MTIHKIQMYQTFAAPIEQVWEAFNDHASLGKIMGQAMERVKDSTDPTNINGVNSTRLIKVPLLPFEETIRKSEKPNLIEYQISKGTPLSHHYGVMRFSSLPDGGAAIDYSIEIGSKIPLLGGIVSKGLEKAISGSLRHYAKRLAGK